MKRIGLISDTHNHIDPSWQQYFSVCDEIWHAGDIGNIEVLDYLATIKPVRAVFGNIDNHILRAELTEDLFFEIEGLKVFMTHIGGYPGKYAARLREIFRSYKPGLFICGHSHLLKVMYDHQYQMLTINPGAAGVHGFHKIKTIMRFEVSESKVSNAEVIELGLKGTIRS